MSSVASIYKMLTIKAKKANNNGYICAFNSFLL